MPITRTDLENEVATILSWSIDAKSTKRIPNADDLTLGRTAKTFTTTVLYTDVRGSSHYAKVHQRRTVAKIFNAFLNGAVRIVRDHNSHVRSFNGDSILAFFTPTLKNACDNAVRSAMKLVNFQDTILQPAMNRAGYKDTFDIGIGIAFGEIMATKVGVEGEDQNAIIWPSNVTNLSAKLGDKGRAPSHIWISDAAYTQLSDNLKFHVTQKQGLFGSRTVRNAMWEEVKDFSFAGERTLVWKSSWSIKL